MRKVLFVYKRYLRLKHPIRFHRLYFRFTGTKQALVTLVNLFILIRIHNIKHKILSYVLQDIYSFVTKKPSNNFQYDNLSLEELIDLTKICNTFFLNNRMFVFLLEDNSYYISFVYNNTENCNFEIDIMHESQKDLCIMGNNKQDVEILYNNIKRDLIAINVVDTTYDYEYNW